MILISEPAESILVSEPAESTSDSIVDTSSKLTHRLENGIILQVGPLRHGDRDSDPATVTFSVQVGRSRLFSQRLLAPHYEWYTRDLRRLELEREPARFKY
jgi:hypothetical protein